MLADVVLDRVAAALDTEAAQDPEVRGQARKRALGNTCRDLAQAIRGTGTQPHHEVLVAAFRAAAQAPAPTTQVLPWEPAEVARGKAQTRRATLDELATRCERLVAETRRRDGSRAPTYVLLAPQYTAAALWRAIGAYFHAMFDATPSEQVQERQRHAGACTTYDREYDHMRRSLPLLLELPAIPAASLQALVPISAAPPTQAQVSPAPATPVQSRAERTAEAALVARRPAPASTVAPSAPASVSAPVEPDAEAGNRFGRLEIE